MKLNDLEEKIGDVRERIPAANLYAIAGSTTLAAFLLSRTSKRPGRAMVGGLAAGVPVGILYALQTVGKFAPKESERKRGPSFASRLLKKVPFRLKAATVAGGVEGAVKHGGKEAGRELKQKAKRTLSRKP